MTIVVNGSRVRVCVASMAAKLSRTSNSSSIRILLLTLLLTLILHIHTIRDTHATQVTDRQLQRVTIEDDTLQQRANQLLAEEVSEIH